MIYHSNHSETLDPHEFPYVVVLLLLTVDGLIILKMGIITGLSWLSLVMIQKVRRVQIVLHQKDLWQDLKIWYRGVQLIRLMIIWTFLTTLIVQSSWSPLNTVYGINLSPIPLSQISHCHSSIGLTVLVWWVLWCICSFLGFGNILPQISHVEGWFTWTPLVCSERAFEVLNLSPHSSQTKVLS